MPIAFASCEILNVRRRGVARAAAYGERRTLTDDAGTTLYDPRYRDDHLAGFTLLPPGFAPRFADPRTLWDAVESRGVGRQSVVGLGFVLGLPADDELTLPECVELVRAFATILHAKLLPVRADLHRVVGADGRTAHRHAHLVVGLFPIEGASLGNTADRRWLPVVRGGVAHTFDWPAIWTEVQRGFFDGRGLALAVPPASGHAEPKVKGRPTRTTLQALAGRRAGEVRDAVRARRVNSIGDPVATLNQLTADWTVVSPAELDAFLAAGRDDRDIQATVRAAILAHPDLVDLDAGGVTRSTEPRYSTRAALERATAIATDLARTERVTAHVAHNTALMVEELLDEVAEGGPDIRRVIIWSDPWLRRSVDEAIAWPPGTRHLAARQLPDLEARDAPVLQWSRRTKVFVLGADRLSDRELQLLLTRVTREGATLIFRCVVEHPLPRPSRGLAPIVLGRILGVPLPAQPDEQPSRQILRNRIGIWRARANRPLSSLEHADVRIQADGATESVSTTQETGVDPVPDVLSPRAAWRTPPERADVVVTNPSDWAWAAPLLRERPILGVRFETGLSDAALVAAVEAAPWRTLDRVAARVGLVTSVVSSNASDPVERLRVEAIGPIESPKLGQKHAEYDDSDLVAEFAAEEASNCAADPDDEPDLAQRVADDYLNSPDELDPSDDPDPDDTPDWDGN